ncbi:unnamed protein product, partial [Effrenium voratum]
MHYPCKNSLAHMLHAPDRDNEERGITVAQMTSSLTWAKAQLTRDGKPGCEAFNRPEVWLSAVMGAAEQVEAILRSECGPGETILTPAARKPFQSLLAQLKVKRASEVLNTVDYPNTTSSKQETEVMAEQLLKGLGAAAGQWAAALASNPDVAKDRFCNGGAQPTEEYAAWWQAPQNGRAFARWLAAQHWRAAASKRHAQGAPREEVAPDAGNPLQWSPVANPKVNNTESAPQGQPTQAAPAAADAAQRLPEETATAAPATENAAQEAPAEKTEEKKPAVKAPAPSAAKKAAKTKAKKTEEEVIENTEEEDEEEAEEVIEDTPVEKNMQEHTQCADTFAFVLVTSASKPFARFMEAFVANFASAPSAQAQPDVELPLTPRKQHPSKDALQALLAEGRRPQLAPHLVAQAAEAGAHLGSRICVEAISQCARAKLWQESVRLFAQMRDVKVGPTVFSYNATISACEKCGQWQSALLLFQRMAEAQIRRSVVSYNACLSSLEKGQQWRKALGFFGSMLTGKLSPDVITYNATISSCEKGGQWQRAVALLGAMPKAKVTPSAITYNAAISSCKADGHWQLALALLTAMPRAKLKPDLISYNAALSTFERLGQWHHALRLLGHMRKSSVRPNVRTYNSAIRSCENGPWQVALDLFGRLVPDELSFNGVIGACRSAQQWHWALHFLLAMPKPTAYSYNGTLGSFVKDGEWQKALCCLLAMPKARLAPDVLSFNATISSCERFGQWTLALHLLQRILEAQLEPSVISFNATMSSCEKGLQWQHALQLLAKMPEHEVPRDVITYNAAISACQKGEQWLHALSLLQLMRASRQADVISFNAAISACEGQPQHAVDLFHEMETLHLWPDTISYNAVIVSCEDWQLALHFLARMGHPDLVSYSSALQVCERQHAWRQVLKLFGEVRKAVPLDRFSYRPTIAACGQGGHWQLALALFEEMDPDDASDVLAAVLSAMEKNRQWQRALWLFEQERPETGYDALAYNATMSACAREKFWAEALRLLEDMCKAEVLPDHVTLAVVLQAQTDWRLALCLFEELKIRPGLVAYNALMDISEDTTSDALFAAALEDNLLPNLVRPEGLLDLHELSFGSAKSAVRWWLQTRGGECILITGWGKSRAEWMSGDLKGRLLAWKELGLCLPMPNPGRLRFVP